MDRQRGRIWGIVIPAALLPGLASICYFVLATESSVTQWIYTFTKIFTLVWPLLAWCLILNRPLHRWHWRAPRHWRSLPLGIATGLAISLIIWIAYLTLLGDVVRGSSEAIRAKGEALGVLDHYLLYALCLAVLHSLIEEYYFRWFIFGRLAEVTRGAIPHLLAGGAFAFHHIIVLSTYFGLGWGLVLGLSVGVGGIIWSVMYQHQRSLLGVWVSHIIVDFAVLAIGYQVIMP